MRRLLIGLCLVGVILTAVVWAAGPRVRRSCLIAWDAVTTNSDASPIGDLQGYRVQTSTTSGTYDPLEALSVGPEVTSVTCRQLGLLDHNQQYYVRVIAYDILGNEGTASTELAVVVTMGGVLFR